MINEDRLKDFFNDIEEVCKKHNISISHEDNHGAFVFIDYVDGYMEWFKEGKWEYCPGGE